MVEEELWLTVVISSPGFVFDDRLTAFVIVTCSNFFLQNLVGFFFREDWVVLMLSSIVIDT